MPTDTTRNLILKFRIAAERYGYIAAQPTEQYGCAVPERATDRNAAYCHMLSCQTALLAYIRQLESQVAHPGEWISTMPVVEWHTDGEHAEVDAVVQHLWLIGDAQAGVGV